MTDIIPITYLIFLSIILTSIFILLVLQIVNFQCQESSLSKKINFVNFYKLSNAEFFSMVNICVNHKKLCLALTILEDQVHGSADMHLHCQSRYYKVISFIFNNMELNTIAKKYYQYAVKLDPACLQSSQNLNDLSSEELKSSKTVN